MNEYPFVKKIMISLIIIQLIIILFSYFVDTSLSNSSFNPTNNQALASLQGSQKLINTTSTNLVNSFNKPTFTYNSCGFSIFGDLSCNVWNFVLGFFNIIISILSVVYNLFLLLIISLKLVFTLFFGVIPSLFNASIFGDFAIIFTIIYSAIIIILTIYGFVVLRDIIAKFIGR